MPRPLLALLILLAALPTHSRAATADTGPLYLALGDSIAVGDGASDPQATAYVPLVHEALRERLPCPGENPCSDLELRNLARGYATTDSLRDTQLPAALELIERRNGDTDPGNDVVAITIDIGGFDAMSRLFQVCLQGVSASCVAAVEDTLAAVDENLAHTLGELRDAAGEETRIAVMTYYNALVACTLQDAAGIARMVLEGRPGLTPGLNAVIREAAADVDARVAETFDLIDDHDLVGGIDCLHPNDAGHAKIAEAFIDALAPADLAGTYAPPASPGYCSRCSRFMRW
jgi:lysophospholipase L1-like esterase